VRYLRHPFTPNSLARREARRIKLKKKAVGHFSKLVGGRIIIYI
jgi:hypothetical protein